ncbi:T9SS type A sorting domain-containing protein [Polaribacter porphyrae]|uniref:Secretion system C-terminal sorting domain-containing protein n=1 Tax=Polaribacter porphyrae TaxID=1137780 RepID=A0A2S7WSR3_9FLAO|nr:T9SS type A sorting domain-containing protein [Polaribacter porphyrae]PQJ80637.1 hypothetical protein BTO18_16285 [Polaribacter porphyrae]
MKKQLLLFSFFLISITSFAQTATIDAAPTSLEQAEVFTMTASFDTGAGDSVEGNLTYLVRLYDTSDNTFSFVASNGVDQDGVNTASGVVSGNITVPADATPTADLAAGFEYRLVVSYKRSVAADFISTAQVVTITKAVVPTITQSVITTADILVDENGKATGWVPTPAISITLENFAPNTTYRVFNQFKITDTNGKQWGGGSIDITTDASGNGVDTTWNPGFFGANGDFNGSETTGYWNSNTTGPAGAVTKSQTFTITQNATLNTKDFSLINVSVFPNPTSDKITIETQQEFKSVIIFDITGKTIKSFNNKQKLNVAELSKGVYFLKTDTGLLGKFIKN